MSIRLLILPLLLAVAAAGPLPVRAEEEGPCLTSENGRLLDFWIGEWTVTDTSGTTLYGENRVERALKGCAIFEHWSGAGGSSGKSLFALDLRANRWEQVWVTEDTSRPGGLKHKVQQAGAPENAVRFQGELTGPKGGTYLDRTTLTPQDGGTVRQQIEVSTDGGKTWRTTFDAVYRRKE